MAKIEIPLDILDVNVIEVEITKKGEIIITVESTIDGTHCRILSRPNLFSQLNPILSSR